MVLEDWLSGIRAAAGDAEGGEPPAWLAQRVLIELAGNGTPFLISLVNYAETLVRPAEDEATLELIAGSIERKSGCQ